LIKRELEQLEPKNIWSIFKDITKVPRASKKEEKIRKWIKNWAEKNNVTILKEDSAGNILLTKEATKDCEKYPTLVIQAHMDMVCQKEPETKIDFDNDPLELVIDDKIVKAKGTSLGADNGIGMAFGLAALSSDNLLHGPLEVLFTVDEETGLTGAFAIKSGFFSGKYLLNVDSESVGTITISSAGGGGTDFDLPIKFEKYNKMKGILLKISGLQGGHSGVDIDLPRLNAIKIGIDALIQLQQIEFYLNKMNAGTVHNAIPRDCEIEFLVPEKGFKKIKKILTAWKEQTIKIGRKTEPNLKIEIIESLTNDGLPQTITNSVVSLLNEIFHGPISFSKEIPGLVQTSNNLAVVKTTNEKIHIHVSTRSSVEEELQTAREVLKTLGEKYSFKITFDEAYPGWKPDPNSSFILMVKKLYEEVVEKKVELQAIHGGLECGLFSALDSELQIASIGPNIKNAHSPDEYVEIESVNILWNIIKKVIENMGTLV